jgi:hypothetical protein
LQLKFLAIEEGAKRAIKLLRPLTQLAPGEWGGVVIQQISRNGVYVKLGA